MAKQEYRAILEQGVEQWNAWRKQNPGINPNLRGADLRGADLSGTDFSLANLSAAALFGADLGRANLHDANLRGADLSLANLSNVNFHGAKLIEAKFFSASLRGASLRGADLRGANLSRTVLQETVLANCNLTDAQELNTCEHQGPSTLDHRTLINSGGLPEEFLKGCGWSDWQIEAAKLYNPSLNPSEIAEVTNQIYQLRQGPLQLANLFISYSHQDAAFVNFLEKRFQDQGIRYWRDIHDASAGPLEKIVSSAITRMGTVLLVLSKHSIESDWVELEVEKARKLAKDNKNHVLCPVALDASWQKAAWPERLMNQVLKYNILDFSNWRDNKAKFEKEYAKLHKGLKLFYTDSDNANV